MSIFSKSTAEEIENKISVYDSQTADLNVRIGELKRKVGKALLQEDPAAGALRKDLRNTQDELEARAIGRAALEREYRSAQRRARRAAIDQNRKAAVTWVKALDVAGGRLRAVFDALTENWAAFYQAEAEIPPLLKGSRRPGPMLQNGRTVMTRFFLALADNGYPPRDDPNQALAAISQYFGALSADLTSILEDLTRTEQEVVDEEEAADRDPLAPPNEGQTEKAKEAR